MDSWFVRNVTFTAIVANLVNDYSRLDSISSVFKFWYTKTNVYLCICKSDE